MTRDKTTAHRGPTCEFCGVKAAPMPRAGKQRRPHQCPHGEPCARGHRLNGVHANHPTCKQCVARLDARSRVKEKALELQSRDLVRRDGDLLVKCPCGHLDSVGVYAAAQIGAGHTVEGHCSKCGRDVIIYGER